MVLLAVMLYGNDFVRLCSIYQEVPYYVKAASIEAEIVALALSIGFVQCCLISNMKVVGDLTVTQIRMSLHFH